MKKKAEKWPCKGYVYQTLLSTIAIFCLEKIIVFFAPVSSVIYKSIGLLQMDCSSTDVDFFI